jgi:conjugal transfer/entry exclusion protein
MAEVVATVGAVAAFSQISSQIFTIAKIAADLTDRFDKAVDDIQNCMKKVALVAESMQALQNDVDTIAARDLIKGSIIDCIRYDISRMLSLITNIQNLCEPLKATGITVRSRLK